ncbi:hypothetical protein [Actinomycetospora flava]|uniref:Transposase n=1 Tax=Actinomycetospora flava TaxID=3129232 RepID=A0ABU8MDE7_9PSEU
MSTSGRPMAETTRAWLARLEDCRWKRLRAEYADAWPDVLSVLVSGGYLWARPRRLVRRPAGHPRMRTRVAVPVTAAVRVADRRETGLVDDLIKSGYAQLGASVPVDLDGQCPAPGLMAGVNPLGSL